MSGNFLSPDISSRYAKAFAETPVAALGRIISLWKNGSSIEENGELCLMLSALSQTLCIDSVREGIPGPVTALDTNLWKACIATELPFVLLDMITDDVFIKQPLRWVKSVVLLNSGIASLWAFHAHPRAANPQLPAPPQSMVKNYLQRVRPVWDVLWDAREYLMSDGNASKPCITPALVDYSYSVTTMHSTLYYEEYQEDLANSPAIVGVALCSWTHAATSANPGDHYYVGQNDFALIVMHMFRITCWNIYIAAGPTKRKQVQNVWRRAIDKAMEGVGPAKVMQAFYTALSTWPGMLDVSLRFCLDELKNAVMLQKEVDGDKPSDQVARSQRAFWDASMLDAVAHALERESASGITAPFSPLSNTENLADICTPSCLLIKVTLEGIRTHKENPPTADGRSIYTILSRTLFLLSRALDVKGREGPQPTNSAVASFHNACILCVQLSSNLKGTPKQVKALKHITQGMKTMASKAWYRDLSLLRNLRDRYNGNDNYNTLLESWISFGLALGLKETAERDRHEAQSKHLCSWVQCRFHVDPSPKPLSVCAGCGERKYCSRECQKRDWKDGGHRVQCRRVKT